MPYLNHFSLRVRPFDLTPNKDFFFEDQHGEILNSIVFALSRGEPILKVVGEVGTGKTMLCRMLVESLHDQSNIAFIPIPQLTQAGMISAICSEFGIGETDTEKQYPALIQFLLKSHADGKQSIVIVDEAQALPRESLETIRLLTNLETDDSKLLQIVMFGQPELERTLQQHDLRQLLQRITFDFSTHPLSFESAVRYVRFRIERSSKNPPPNDLFTDSALKTLVLRTKGVPRLMNIVADKALLSAYASSSTKVERHHVRQALRDTKSVGRTRLALPRIFQLPRIF